MIECAKFAIAFLKAFLPLQKPPNFQLVADERETRLGFKRHRESVAAFAINPAIRQSRQAA